MAYETLQSLINQQGLTAAQAMQKYTIGQDVIDGLVKQGVTFASAPVGAPAPAPSTYGSSAYHQAVASGDEAAATALQRERLNLMFASQGKPEYYTDTTTQLTPAGGYTGTLNNLVAPSDPSSVIGRDQVVNPYYMAGGAGATASPSQGQSLYDMYGSTTAPVAGVPAAAAQGLIDSSAPRPPKNRGPKGAAPAIPAPAPGMPTSASPAPAAAPTSGGYSANGYTAAPPPAQPAGGTVLPGSGLMDAYTVPNANTAQVGDIGAATAASAAPVDASRANASDYKATDAKASTWTPDENSTVQGQIRNVIAEDSPLMQQAATRGLQQANKRGLMNSSMAVQSGQAALYDAAMPIATQDANTFAQAGQFNAQAGTQVSMANAAARNAAAQFKAQTATDVSKFNADTLFKSGVINQEQANKMAMFNASELNKSTQLEFQTDADVQKFNASESNALLKLGMDSQTKMALANIEASYKMLMQTSASSAEVYKTLVGQMGSILGNKDMDAAAKAAAIGNLVGALNASLGVLGSINNLDLPELDMGGLPEIPGAASAIAASVLSGSGYYDNSQGSSIGPGDDGMGGGSSVSDGGSMGDGDSGVSGMSA